MHREICGVFEGKVGEIGICLEFCDGCKCRIGGWGVVYCKKPLICRDNTVQAKKDTRVSEFER